MENYRKVLIFVMCFLVTFIGGIIVTELSAYLLTLPNTIANIFGYIILITTFVLILLLGHKLVKSLNK
jgi:hypothetical protein